MRCVYGGQTYVLGTSRDRNVNYFVLEIMCIWGNAYPCYMSDPGYVNVQMLKLA